VDDKELYRLFKRVVDTASVEFYLLNAEGRFGYVNQAAAKSLGYSEEELLALHIADVDLGLGPDFPSCFLALKGQDGLQRETTQRTRDGRLVEKDLSLNYLILDSVGYLSVFARDISERKRMENALRESEEQYRELFENASDLIQIVRPDGRFLFVNPAWLETFGYSREEVARLTIFDLIDPECAGHCQETFQNVIRAGRVERIESSFVAKSGAKVILQGSANCRYEKGEPRFARCIFRNVTEEKKLQAQLLQSQKMEAVGRLTSGVAHDFNNLLTTILSYSELYLMRLPQEDPLAEALRAIRDAGTRGAALTRQLLTFSRNQVVDVRVIDLNRVVSDLGKMIRRLLHPDISFSLEVAPEPTRILADPHQIEQVLLNLVINARDAMPNGGELTVACGEELLEAPEFSNFASIAPGHYVVLTVRDTGEGMSKEVQEQIFEPFFTTKPQGKGTGLGLATAYGIVKQHSGYIVVRSEVGSGALFRLYFPMVQAPVESVVSEAVFKVLQGRETILVVDDEPEILEVVRLSLEPLGYEVLVAASGREALRIAGEKGRGGIELLLADLIMPDMNGRKLAEKMRLLHPAAKVLFMSGYADSMLAEFGVSPAPANFISKPLAPGELATALRRILD